MGIAASSAGLIGGRGQRVGTRAMPLNTSPPLIMHIDLNSCFSTIEQQANPLIRNKPVAVAAYTAEHGIVLAASYDAKALGIKLGTSVREARAICPGIVILMPDPPKYREAHRRFKDILLAYTSDVVPKSIDEFVLDFRGSPAVRAGRDLREVGLEIKQRISQGLGDYVTVNVGIGPNRFFAKYAAGLHKPDGLDLIDHTNLQAVLAAEPELMALPGINRRYKARLLAAGIRTPYEFYGRDGAYLQNFVFFSKVGHYWHSRLHGWEVDDREFQRRTIGHQYALENKTADRAELKRLLMKLCEKVGRRLRGQGLTARGIDLHLRYISRPQGRPVAMPAPRYAAVDLAAGDDDDEPRNEGRLTNGGMAWGRRLPDARHWHKSHRVAVPLYATQDIFRAACQLLDGIRLYDVVSLISITVYDLEPVRHQQLDLFDLGRGRLRALADAADVVNDRYGEFTLTPATMANMDKTILDRIAFGNVREL